MKLSELARRCAEALEIEEAHQFGVDPGVNLVHPKGVKGRFPLHGRLLCVNSQEDRVYSVKVADALAFISRTLKANRRAVDASNAPPQEPKHAD